MPQRLFNLPKKVTFCKSVVKSNRVVSLNIHFEKVLNMKIDDDETKLIN